MFEVGIKSAQEQLDKIKQEFTKAYLLLPDNTMKVFEVKCWNDYEFSDQLQFTTKDGTTYLTHASRIIFTDEKD